MRGHATSGGRGIDAALDAARGSDRQIVGREVDLALDLPFDGQILVTHDLIGAFPWFCPPFAIPKANVAESISQAVSAYVEDVRTSHD